MSVSRSAPALPEWLTDTPVAGFYAMPLCRRGIPVAIRLYWGQPIIDGVRQDRSPRWCVIINGSSACNFYSATGGEVLGRVPHDVERVWPYCARWPISPFEYRFLLRRAAWARHYAPDHPAARPWQPVDIRNTAPAF
jgi:hypothetical protein